MQSNEIARLRSDKFFQPTFSISRSVMSLNSTTLKFSPSNVVQNLSLYNWKFLGTRLTWVPQLLLVRTNAWFLLLNVIISGEIPERDMRSFYVILMFVDDSVNCCFKCCRTLWQIANPFWQIRSNSLILRYVTFLYFLFSQSYQRSENTNRWLLFASRSWCRKSPRKDK